LGFDPVVHLDGPIDTVTSQSVATNLLAVLHEALSNVARHAHATAVQVSISAGPESISLEVRDNGVGLDNRQRNGNGLRNIKQRAQHLGGSSVVTPNGERGTLMHWTVPSTQP
jgi:signal transduction histidine kinase